MSPKNWEQLLVRISRDVLSRPDAADGLPQEVRASGWLGFSPASETVIVEAEKRLGTQLPPSLRSFYKVTNGWRTVGHFIWDVLPVEQLGWLKERDTHLYQLASETEKIVGPFKDDPQDLRLKKHRYEQGTRVKRSLAVTSWGDAAIWLLDPEVPIESGEWEGGRWASWSPAMEWFGTSFAGLMRIEHEHFLELE